MWMVPNEKSGLQEQWPHCPWHARRRRGRVSRESLPVHREPPADALAPRARLLFHGVVAARAGSTQSVQQVSPSLDSDACPRSSAPVLGGQFGRALERGCSRVASTGVSQARPARARRSDLLSVARGAAASPLPGCELGVSHARRSPVRTTLQISFGILSITYTGQCADGSTAHPWLPEATCNGRRQPLHRGGDRDGRVRPGGLSVVGLF
jgi:hypothetical protein